MNSTYLGDFNTGSATVLLARSVGQDVARCITSYTVAQMKVDTCVKCNCVERMQAEWNIEIKWGIHTDELKDENIPILFEKIRCIRDNTMHHLYDIDNIICTKVEQRNAFNDEEWEDFSFADYLQCLAVKRQVK